MQVQKTGTAGSRKPILNRRVLLLQAFAILAMLLVAWLLWKRGQPERLLNLDAARRYDLLAGGTLYRFGPHDNTNRSGVVILSRPVQGGAERTLVMEDSRYDLFAPTGFAVSDSSLFYGLRPHQNPVAPNYTVGAYTVGGAIAIRYLGVFAPSVNRVLAPGNAPEKRVTRSQGYLPPIAVRFRQARIQGGAVADLATSHVRPVFSLKDRHLEVVRGENLAVYREALYCLVRQGLPIPTESRQVLLARVHADRPGSLDIVCRLPVYAEDFRFDQGYLYYTVLETEHSLLGTLVGDDVGGRYRHMLYRVPLPR